MSEKALIAREIQAIATQARIRGRVASAPELKFFDPGGTASPTWVCDVDVGEDRLLRDVPIKVNGPKARFYAQLGSPVWLDRDAQGRYQVTAPADRTQQPGNLIEIDEDTGDAAAAGSTGLTIVREPYEFYKGETPESFFDPSADGDTLLWLRAYDRLTGLPANLIAASDADGADVLQMVAKSPTTISALATVNRPLYRKFDSGNPNDRSTVDFDGINDGMDLSANVVESTPGQLSIFAVVNKDATGSGIDAVLELANFRLLSRTGGDTWGIDAGAGAGAGSSGFAVGSGFTLIEAIATAYNSIALYQDGVLQATITAAAAGLGLSDSSLGYSFAAAAGSHDGRIAEVLVLDRAVTAADRVAIEAYFNQSINVAFARYANGVDGYPKISVYDANGVEV